MFARGAYPSNLWQKIFHKAELFSYECNWQVDGEDIEDGRKMRRMSLSKIDDEQTSDETDSSSSSEKD